MSVLSKVTNNAQKEIFFDQRVVDLDVRLGRLEQDIATTRVFRIRDDWADRINMIGRVSAGTLVLTSAVYVFRVPVMACIRSFFRH
jgi:hypothetical protein